MQNDFEKQISELAKAKILRELAKESAAANNVINNYAGGGIPTTLKEQMNASAPNATNPDDEDYYVGIQRTPRKDGGWNKMVKRFKTKRGEKSPSIDEMFG